MKIGLVTPVRPGSTSGNSVTAGRWADLLTDSGHVVTVIEISPAGDFASDQLQDVDVLIVLHARRSAPAARWWRDNRGEAPLVVGLAGTDLYVDLPADQDAQWSIGAADRLVVLQDAALGRLEGMSSSLGAKTTVIHQSVGADGALDDVERAPHNPAEFRVVVLSHLRDVKDPLMCARAARLLPDFSTVVVHHVGAAHNDEWEELANNEMATNGRYWWHGPLDRPDALQLLATADVLACTSLLEGGANVVSEALALGVPVIGTDIEGNTGLLGADYPGLVPVQDDLALSQLLTKLEAQPDQLQTLQDLVDARRPLVLPETERQTWASLILDLGSSK